MSETYPNENWRSLEPADVWNIFAGISAVPRPSGKEERIRAHILDLARERGIAAREDDAGNILLTVPGSPGFEHAPVTVLQGHLDMVCEKNSDTRHDFDADPIRLLVDRESGTDEIIVRADGTTLGADNGIGVALSLAAATDPKCVHGPLEILCTVDEEVGLNGVKRLRKGFFTGRRLLNLDSEGDDTLTIGCAGGADTTLIWRFRPEPVPSDFVLRRVRVRGLRGGHSGGDIHKNLGNANRVLVAALAGTGEMRLVSIQGGSKRNAISREASALVAVSPVSAADLVKATATVQAESIAEHHEPDCVIEISDGVLGDEARQARSSALGARDTETLLTALSAAPHGVVMMEPGIPTLVRTSTNLATLNTEHDGGAIRITLGCLSRSSSRTQLHDVLRRIESIGKLSGAQSSSGNEYGGWTPDPNSPLLALCRSVYAELNGTEPKVEGIHAGLECGILAEKGDSLQMVSLGARVEGAHSPDERVYVGSVQKTWTYLRRILEELARTKAA